MRHDIAAPLHVTIILIIFTIIADVSGMNIDLIYKKELLLPLVYAQEGTPESNVSQQTPAAENSKVHGILLVTTHVINDSAGTKKPSDFTIFVHGNNPSLNSFPGNSSGTAVKLEMGMYSVTESGPANYNSSYSENCSGAIMSVMTMKCDITNMYIGPTK
jgi:hypothetical protein